MLKDADSKVWTDAGSKMWTDADLKVWKGADLSAWADAGLEVWKGADLEVWKDAGFGDHGLFSLFIFLMVVCSFSHSVFSDLIFCYFLLFVS